MAQHLTYFQRRVLAFSEVDAEQAAIALGVTVDELDTARRRLGQPTRAGRVVATQRDIDRLVRGNSAPFLR